METIGIIIIGALAFRGVSSMTHSYINRDFLSLPLFFSSKAGFNILQTYLFVAIPIALFNGYAMNGWIGMLIIGVGTWLGMLVANILLRFNPILQFILFGLINIIWTIYNIVQFF